MHLISNINILKCREEELKPNSGGAMLRLAPTHSTPKHIILLPYLILTKVLNFRLTFELWNKKSKHVIK